MQTAKSSRSITPGRALTGVSNFSPQVSPGGPNSGSPVATIQRSDSGTLELEDQHGIRKSLNEDVVTWFHKRNTDTLQGALAFVPWILQQSHAEDKLNEDSIIVHRGTGAVVFSDASGFTALTERLAKKSNGAELLSKCLDSFFTPLINLIHSYRGDVIKFSGDALMIYFPAVDDTAVQRSRLQVPPHGSYGLPDLGPMSTAVLRASACCIEIHKRLHMFDTGVDGVCLCLHIGVGCGDVTILQVGGEIPPETHVPRCEYLIAGPPLEQISVAEPLAKNGETCLSPQAWEHVKDCVIEDESRRLDEPDYHLLLRMDEKKYTFPTVKFSAMECDRRYEQQFKLSELPIIRRYVPSAVFKQIEGGTLTYVNEMRTISTIFVGGSGIDVSTDEGSAIAQELMSSVQKICYAGEGTLNKFVIDDKGMLFLLVYGLPPLVHTDGPTRAVLACLQLVKAFKALQITGRFGVTTGRGYCGTCGSASRMEYTVLGDVVNLSARLMSNAAEDSILVDQSTKDQCTREVSFNALSSIKVKGKADAIPIYEPRLRPAKNHIGLGPDGRVHFPWYARPSQGSGGRKEAPPDVVEAQFKANVQQLCSLSNWDSIKQVTALLGSKNARSTEVAVPQPSKGRGSVGPDSKRASMVSSIAAQGVQKGSPFLEGGVVLLEGNAGTGKIELAEYMAVYAQTHLHMLPICGSIGPRVNDIERLGVELVLSALGALRHLDASVPFDPLQALDKVLANRLEPSELEDVRDSLAGKVDGVDDHERLLESCVNVALLLIEVLRRQTPLIIVLQLETGTSLFRKTKAEFNIFWSVASRLSKLAMPDADFPSEAGKKQRRGSFSMMNRSSAASGVPSDPSSAHSNSKEDNPIVVCVLAKEVDRTVAAVNGAIKKDWLVVCNGLPEEMCGEYIATYLGVPPSMLPGPLRDFISTISLGNPLFIRETLDQLLSQDLIRIRRGRDNEASDLSYHQDLEGINIASWYQTSMVGETVCLLESLDPLQAAVLKMSTVFTGPFTLPDLAASSCSSWAGAVNFDHLRLFRAVQDLVRRGIIESVPFVPNDDVLSHNGGQELQRFEMRNVLIRKVGSAMLLESQKKVVKRQALIDRALMRDLPARLEELNNKKLEPHIPWYYESVLQKSS